MANKPLQLDLEQCRARQRWLAEKLVELELERAILLLPEHVQYFTGFRPHKLMTALVAVEADARCRVVTPNREPEYVAADEIRTFEAQWHCTLRQDQVWAMAEVLDLEPVAKLGVEYSRFPPQFAAAGDALVNLEPELRRRRRKKDADELAMIRRAIDCTEAMYAKAKEIIEPGISEIDVFNALHAAGVEVAGEPLTDLGNDYRSNDPGGPPRRRRAEAGELFILDLGPAYRGYYADNCRTFAVDGKPTDVQQQAWQTIVGCLDFVEDTVRPGASCRELFERVQARLDESEVGEFPHHLGHGIGLYPHETPHLNPRWDDVFEEGDVFTAEPGLYAPDLSAGIRLEQNYVVTETGVQRLTSFPLELV